MKLHLYSQQFEYMFSVFYGMKKAGASGEEFDSIYADLEFEAKEHYGLAKFKEVTDLMDAQIKEFANEILLHSSIN